MGVHSINHAGGLYTHINQHKEFVHRHFIHDPGNNQGWNIGATLQNFLCNKASTGDEHQR